MPTAGTLSELASFPDSRLRILNAENGLLIMMGSLDRVVAHYAVERAWESVRLERYADLCRMVRFNRSMNDVFNVEESLH